MRVRSLASYRECRVNAVYDAVELELKAAREAIMQRALRRLVKADPQLTLEPVLERLGRLWSDACPITKARLITGIATAAQPS